MTPDKGPALSMCFIEGKGYGNDFSRIVFTWLKIAALENAQAPHHCSPRLGSAYATKN
jgi:hypothetical protein